MKEKPPFDLDGLRAAYDEILEFDRSPLDLSNLSLVQHGAGFYIFSPNNNRNFSIEFSNTNSELNSNDFFIEKNENYVVDEQQNISILLNKAFFIVTKRSTFNYQQSYKIGQKIFKELILMSDGKYKQGIETGLEAIAKMNKVLKPVFILKQINVEKEVIIFVGKAGSSNLVMQELTVPYMNDFASHIISLRTSMQRYKSMMQRYKAMKKIKM